MTTEEGGSKLLDDITKFAKQFKLTGLDFDAVLQGRREDVEALLEVGRIAQGGAKSLTQKQAEMLRASVEDLRNVLGAQAMTEGAPREAAQQVAQRAISDVAELAQIALKTHSDAFDTVRKRAQKDIDELKALAIKPK
jgi:hypothetical protein